MKLWEPPNANLRAREIRWLNTTYNAHSIFCGCNTPSAHLLACMFSDLDSPDDEDLQKALEIIKQKKQQQQCHTTEGGILAIEGGSRTDENLDILQDIPGDLDDLFAEDGVADGELQDTG